MMQKKKIRALVRNDLDAVMAIEQRSYQIPWKREHFLSEFENIAAEVVGCFVDDQLAGYICFWLIAGEMQVINIAVDPDYRRLGVGHDLLGHAFKQCRKMGMVSAWLDVRAGNEAAIALYQRYGFVVSGSRSGYYRDGEDALLMVYNTDRVN